MFVSFDEYVGRDEGDGSLLLRDVIGGPNPQGFKHEDPEVDKLLRAITDELPFMSPKERQVLAWKLDQRAGTLSQFAADNGISKGYASKLHDRVVQRLTDRMKKN
jgi:DNA-directed RNA polymerase specialized sigma subunit